MSKDEILNYFSDINYAYNDSTRLDTLSRMLDELIKDAAPRWHRVEDGLPEIGHPVVVSNNGDIWTATRLDEKAFGGRRYWEYSDGDWVRIEDDMYWMPIEPPKEDADGNK